MTNAKLVLRNILLTTGFKEFVKEDWYGFGDAERFEGDLLPILNGDYKDADGTEMILLYDNAGFWQIDAETGHCVSLNMTVNEY